MTDLYELTRALVRRGCPEHPRLLWVAGLWMDHHPLKSDRRAAEFHPDDARAIWTLWALEWWIPHNNATEREGHEGPWNLSSVKVFSGEAYCEGSWDDEYRAASILEAIEAATRHLEPTEHEEDFKHAEPGCD